MKNKQQEEQFYKVNRIIEIDLVELENGDRVRLIGLKALVAPSRKDVEVDQYGIIVKDTDPTTTTEERAFEFVRNLLLDKQVRVEYDSRKRDDSYSLYGYVFLKDETFVNAEILRQGFANLQLTPPNLKYADRLREAYREARGERRGLHEDY